MFVSVLIACGGGGGGGGTPTPTPTTQSSPAQIAANVLKPANIVPLSMDMPVSSMVPQAAQPGAATPDINLFVKWAETAYPKFFSPSQTALQTYETYLYRYYPDTDTLLAVSTDNFHVFVWSTTLTKSTTVDLGPLTSYSCLVAPSGCVTPPLVCTLPQVLTNGVCETPPPVCTLPQILTNGVCVTPPPVCTLPQVLTNGVCVTPPPVCTLPQVLTNGVCVTPPPVCTLPQVLTNGVCVTPPPVCTLPQVLTNGVCVTPPPVCTLPQVLTNGVCVTPPPVCTLPQVLTNGVCVTPPPVCTLPQVLTNGVCVTPPPVCTLPQVLTNGVCVTMPRPLVSQVINFPAPGNHGVGDSFTLSASSTSRMGIIFTTSDANICSTLYLPLTGTMLQPKGIGTCTITASQPGNSVYAPAVPVARSILITAATPQNPQVPPGASYSTIPLVHSIPAPVYTSSYDAQTLDAINAARDSCGFGMLKQDVRLDKAANAHSKYMLKNNYLGHYEDSAKPMFTGVAPADRMAAAGYSNIYDSSEAVTGSGFSNLSEMSAIIPSEVAAFLSTPYHALEMLAPRLDIGIANQWNSNVGLPVDPLNPFQSVAIVYDYGVPGVLQDLPSNKVVTYPCDGSRVAPAMYAESPNPFPSRNLSANPVGGSIYIAAKYGSNIQVTSSALVNVATGQPVPLLAPRYGDQELYPGTGSRFGSALLMNWVFITPDLPLSPSTSYRFTISGTVSGLPFTNTATYQTNAY